VTALIRGSSKQPGGPYRKPRADFYTVALVLALIAVILAIVCLWVLMGAYDKQFKGAPVPAYSARSQPGTVPLGSGNETLLRGACPRFGIGS
jgi:hypothetical protein